MRRLFRLFGRTGIVTAIVKDSTGSTYNYGDFTNTNAFLWSDLNLSPYAGTDLGSTPYYIEVLDAAGKKAIGYIGAIGLGETLSPTELVTNGDFASAEPPGTAWRRDAGWTISGGVLVAASGPGFSQIYQFTPCVNGELFKGVITILNYVSGSVGIMVGAIRSGEICDGNGNFSFYSTGIDVSGTASVYSYNAVALQGDNYSIKRVTDPPSTAVHIVSSLNGTARDWASIESGFAPNTIASWKIYSL